MDQHALFIKLATTIKNHDKYELACYAVCLPHPNHQSAYSIQIWSEESLITLSILRTEADFAKYGSSNAMLCTKILLRPADKSAYSEQQDLLIYQMQNYSSTHYIGTCQHEAAFRLSFLLGLQGRVTTIAEHSTHVFHYLNGFRSGDEKINHKIAAYLAEEKKRHEQLDTRELSNIEMRIPAEIIEEKMKQLHIDEKTRLADYQYVYMTEDKCLQALTANMSQCIYRIAFLSEADAEHFLLLVKKGSYRRINSNNT